MSDQPPPPGNPAWPGQPGQPVPPTQPAVPAPPPRPTWTRAIDTDADGDITMAEVKAFWRREVDLKLVIAVLIGLVSVTAAFMTWRSSQLGENATDRDRQAVAETVRLQQDAANDEITLQDARTRFAQHAAALVAADQLDADADRFEQAGDDTAATNAREDAEQQRLDADRILQGGSSVLNILDYATAGDDGQPALDTVRFRHDLDAISRAESQIDPRQTIRRADSLRRRSQHYDLFVIPLVGAVVLLTFAQITARKPLRVGFAAVAVGVWIVGTIVGFGGKS